MARGGVRPGSGRKKDPKNDLIRAVTSAIKTVGAVTLPTSAIPNDVAEVDPNLTPLDYLLGIVRDPSKSESDRVRAAALALPFVHAKPGEAGKKESKQQAAANAATGKFAVPMAPRLVKNG